MKALSRLLCVVLFALAAIPAAGQNYYYIRSNAAQPWGQSTNESAMDSAFGAGNWMQDYYETVNVSGLLSGSVQFIFLEGGDSSYTAFSSFMSTNLAAVTNWVRSGGRLLIMCAPNNPLVSATATLPDNIVLSADAFYGSAASSAYAADISNPIFSGPNSTAYYFTGDFFAHGYFSGADVSAILESNLGETVLGQDPLGTGLMVFGGLTTDNFDLPQPAAHSLIENIIYYTAFTSL